jgi:lysyl-tRNA synthetase class 2
MYSFDPSWLAKLEELRAQGVQPYPSASAMPVTHTSTELHRAAVGVEDVATLDLGDVSIGGRVMFRNVMGKAMFLRVQDRGAQDVADVDREGQAIRRGGILQVYARREEIGEAAFDLLKRVDIGDFVWVRGKLMRTKTGELSLQAAETQLAAKIVTPFPDRWHSVTDVETRSRQRYVDLFINPESREVFRRRSQIVRKVRDFFEARDFLEVETPMMHAIPGGAAARPFVTHHNTLDIDLYLRVAPELYLKRLVVGGFDRVFEVNRNFRNEGVSTRHNPEFTMIEFYWAWATVDDLMRLSEDLIGGLAKDVTGGYRIQFSEFDIDFTPPFRRADMDALIAEATGLSREALRDPEAMRAWWVEKHRPKPNEPLPKTMGRWWEKLFEEHVEHTLINPTFVTGFPAEISPLARRSDTDPDRTDRFELFCATWEIANGFNELNDPVDQAERFAAQVAERAAGNEESMFFDRDYIRALTYGMPPTAGEGIGIDRLTMLLTGRTSIREVILFPTLRPERWDGDAPPEGGTA